MGPKKKRLIFFVVLPKFFPSIVPIFHHSNIPMRLIWRHYGFRIQIS